MNAENFPIFHASDGMGYTVRRDNMRYRVVSVIAETVAATATMPAIGESFESRHAAVAAAQRRARHRSAGS
ncbi:MAG: hypothetical protein ACR2M3_17520 [Thermomicrobiales bacterium]